MAIKEKQIKFQIFRAYAIIAVVLIHTIPAENNLVLRQMFNFAVPMFIFLAGYFYDQLKFEEQGFYYICYKVNRIVIPYIFWSILIFITLIITNKMKLNAVPILLLTGGASGPYYYIIVLLQLILISPLMTTLNKSNIGNLFLFLITPISLIILYILRIKYGFDQSGNLYALPFTIWFIFYYLGYLVRTTQVMKYLRLNKSRSVVFLSLFLVFFYVLSIIEATVILSRLNNISFAVSQIKFSSFLMSLSAILRHLYGF